MIKAELSELVLNHLGDWSSKSGAVLYSEMGSIREAPFYLMGINPGGEADHEGNGDSIAGHLCAPDGTNSYADEWWGEPQPVPADFEDPPGHLVPEKRTPLQACVCNLISMTGIQPRSMPSTNLIFARSPRIAQLRDKAEWKRRCRPVHLALLRAVQPRWIITLGITTTFDAVEAGGGNCRIKCCRLAMLQKPSDGPRGWRSIWAI